ncbi:hypothetical protein C8R45DRAFT_1103820 [Mycena sanguinolenta]|nr:hypothetical protein C8R45DRAFT_1103820 [Mycena sanguinolenta]
MTIGSRFGDALDKAARARLTNPSAVSGTRAQDHLRVELVKEYVRKHFPSHSLLDYA